MTAVRAIGLRAGSAWAVLLMSLAPAHDVAAQPPVTDRVGTPAPGITLTVGIEPDFVLTLSYLDELSGGKGFGARIKLPTTVVRNAAWRLDLLSTQALGGDADWAVPVTTAVYVAHNRNRAGELLGFGIELRAAPGRYWRRGSVALDLGGQATLLTRIRHSDASRAAFDDRYPGGSGDPSSGVTGPVDGWYSSTAIRWRLGLSGSRTVASRTLVQAAAGALFASQRQGVLLGFDLGQLPFYAEAGVRRGW